MQTLNYRVTKEKEKAVCHICNKSFDENETIVELFIPCGDDDAFYSYEYCLKCGADMIRKDIKSINKKIDELNDILKKIKIIERRKNNERNNN